MFCEPFRQSLMDAAANGTALARSLELHLQECPACRVAYAEEQELSRSIDSALWTAANAPVPASLVPRIQAALVREPSKWGWRMSVFTFAGAVVIVAVVGLVIFYRHDGRPNPMVEHGVEPPNTVASTPGKQAPQAEGKPAAVAVGQHSPVAVYPVMRRSEPEVVVSLDEQAGLRRYEAVLRTRGRWEQAAAVETAQLSRDIQPLEIAEIEARDLAIQPLEVTDSN